MGIELYKRLVDQAERLVAINRRKMDHQNEILCDLGVKTDVDRAASELLAKFPEKSDVTFVLNAAAYGDDVTVSDVEPSELGKLMYTNVFSQLALIEELLKAGHRVRLVGITSHMGSVKMAPETYNYAYCVSKAGLNLSVRLLQKQYRHLDYVLIHPGWMQTRMGGPGARVDPADSATSIMDIMRDASKWNLEDGMINIENGQIEPW